MRATYLLLLINVILYAIGITFPHNVLLYGFSHANTLHLLLNMMGLLTLGLGVERIVGSLKFAVLYLSCIVVGGLWHFALTDGVPLVGASAGVYGLAITYALLEPSKRVLLLVFPMRAITLAYVLFGVELLMILMGWLPQIAHFAHLGGAIAGGCTALLWRMSWSEK